MFVYENITFQITNVKRTEQNWIYKDFHLLYLAHLLFFYRRVMFIVSGVQTQSAAPEMIPRGLNNEMKGNEELSELLLNFSRVLYIPSTN